MVSCVLGFHVGRRPWHYFPMPSTNGDDARARRNWAGTAICTMASFLAGVGALTQIAPIWIPAALGVLAVAGLAITWPRKKAPAAVSVKSSFVVGNSRKSKFTNIKTNAENVFGGDVIDSEVDNIVHKGEKRA